jgi:hypothetical protein
VRWLQRALKQAASAETREALQNKAAAVRRSKALRWIPEIRIIICCEHEYAIGSITQHLRIFYSGKDVEKRAVVTAFAHYDLHKPKDVPLPPPLREPFQELVKPVLAFICEEPST